MSTIYRTARKSYDGCCMCGGSIRAGQQYCDHGRGERECQRCIGTENLPAPNASPKEVMALAHRTFRDSPGILWRECIRFAWETVREERSESRCRPVQEGRP